MANFAGLAAVCMVATACRGRGGETAGGAGTHDAAGGAEAGSATGCARPAAEVKGPYVDLCLSPEEVETFAAALRDGVRQHDAAKVASLMRYPLRVHTAACVKHLATRVELVARYDDVFTAALRRYILSTHPPFFVRDGSILLADGGRVWAWSGAERRLLVGGVFLGGGDLPDVPCADRVVEPTPETVWGTWAVSSVRAGEMEELRSFPWQKWKRLTVSLDRAQRTLTSSLGGQEKTCPSVWFARDEGRERAEDGVIPPCSAFETFFGPYVSHGILRASCSGGDLVANPPRADASVAPELVVLDDRTLVVRLACEGIAVLKRRSPQELVSARRAVPRGAACGTADVECTPDAQCVAVSSHPLTERCLARNQHAG